tara:strand:- start:3413 stop:6673 length:3261 start_codon:yes stop_codon:yes gene_type:complete
MWIFNLLVKAAFMIASNLMVAGVGSTVALAIGFTVVATGTLAVGQAIGRRMAPPEIGLGQQGMSIMSNAPSNTAPLPVIYGTRRVGGTRVFIGTSDGYDDDGNIDNKNYFLNMVFAVAEGPVAEISAVYLNNVEVWPNMDPRFDNGEPVNKAVYVEPYVGKANQSASQLLIDISNSKGGVLDDWAWTANHKLSGVAYVYLALAYDPEIWAAGVPIMTCDVKGRVVEDSRPTVVPGYAFAIEKYSDNPALCIKDYLTNTTYGRGIDSALIGNTSFNAAANYCDELVSYTQIVNGIQTTVSQKRYTLNGVVNTAETNMNSLEKMLSSCRGSLVFSGGFYKLIIDKPVTASHTFDESNVLPNYEIIRGGKSFLANQVSVNYFNPEAEWQADFAFEKSSAYLAEDNDLFLEKTLELPFTANTLTAKHIALQTLKASRQNIIFNFKTTQEGLLAEVGDVVYIKLEAPGWDTLNSNAGKEFRILQMSIEATDEVMITAVEYDVNVYSTETFTYDTSRNTNLPSLGTVEIPTNITATETLLFNEPKITNRITLNWTKSLDSFVSSYDVGYMKGDLLRLVEKINVSGTQANFDNLKPGLYTFFIRARNNAGYTSEYTSKILKVKSTTVLPAVNPPGISGVTESLVSTTLGSGIKAKAVFSWAAIANPDWEAIGVNIESYEVEFKLQSTSGNFERIGSSTGTFFEFTDIAPGVYNFRVRAVNDAGIKSLYSETAAEITALSAPPTNVNNFYLRAESTQANLSWTPTPDLDVKVGGTFQIRHSVATSGATWQTAIRIGSDIPGSANSASMPLLVGTYLIKAVDSTGNKSVSAKTIVNTVSPSLLDKRVQQTVTDTAFAGTKSDMIIDTDTGYLKFEADAPWDSISGNMDTWGLIDSIGGADTSGYYLLNNVIDLGQVGDCALVSSITFNTVSASNVWDNLLANIDTWENVDADSFDDIDATLFVSVTNDNPSSGSPTWTDYQELTIGTYYGRGFRFKLTATSEDPTHQINVTQLQIKAEVFYRLESETSTTATGGSAFTYDKPFLATPQIAITANDMATGDYYAITSSSSTGFTLRFYNSGGTGISRTAYYLARGY